MKNPNKVWVCNVDGRRQRLVAAPTKAAAARAIGVPIHRFNGYGHESGQPDHAELATREPGAVWEKTYRSGSTWAKVTP